MSDRMFHSNKEYLKILNTINSKIDMYVQNELYKINEDLSKYIISAAERFALAEEDIRRTVLGIDENSKYEKISDFKNRTGDMKAHTGYVLYFDGKKISQKGIISNNSLVNLNPISHIGYSKAKEGKLNRYINLAIFTTSEHSGYVENLRRKRKNNISMEKRNKDNKYVRTDYDLYQGTGWFQLYTSKVLVAFYHFFVMDKFLKDELNVLHSKKIDISNRENTNNANTMVDLYEKSKLEKNVLLAFLSQNSDELIIKKFTKEEGDKFFRMDNFLDIKK